MLAADDHIQAPRAGVVERDGDSRRPRSVTTAGRSGPSGDDLFIAPVRHFNALDIRLSREYFQDVVNIRIVALGNRRHDRHVLQRRGHGGNQLADPAEIFGGVSLAVYMINPGQSKQAQGDIAQHYCQRYFGQYMPANVDHVKRH